MFEETRKDSPAPASTKQLRAGRLLYILGGLIAVLLVLAAFLAYKTLALRGYKVPDSITKQTSYPIFVPKKLPHGYKVNEDSFAVGEGTLIFQARDSSGSSIAFTEQKRPANFDFEKFYQQQMKDSKRLDGTAYPSVMGKLPNGEATLLSVVTNDTWIIASTSAPLGQQDLTDLAKGLKQY
jgi:hypothetical protein